MPGHGSQVDLVWAVRQPQRPGPHEEAAQREVGVEAARAVRLDGAVHHGEAHARRGDLDHRDLGRGDLVTHAVHHVRRLEGEQPRLLYLQPAEDH